MFNCIVQFKKGDHLNPFMEEKEPDSDVEDPEIDDQRICMLRQLKRSVETLKKYNELHETEMDELNVSHVSIQRVIQSPLKLSLSQIFHGHENDFLDAEQIKRKFYNQLGRDFHYNPNYETNTNVG
jgi:hypothetical protein